MAESSSHELSPEERNAILQREITKYLANGYRVVSQTDTTAQLVKPKTLSCLWIILFGLTLIGLIIYVVIYLVSKDKQVYIVIDPGGQVRTHVPGQVQSLEESAEARAAWLEMERATKAQHDAEKKAWKEAHPDDTHPEDRQRYLLMYAIGLIIFMACFVCAMAYYLGTQPAG